VAAVPATAFLAIEVYLLRVTRPAPSVDHSWPGTPTQAVGSGSPGPHYLFSIDDIHERAFWDDYMAAQSGASD
jgi:hypothetical protein